MKIEFSTKLLIITVIAATAASVLLTASRANAEALSPGAINFFTQDAGQSTGNTAGVTGKWLLSWQGRKKSRQATLEIQQNGSKLTGTLSTQGNSESISGNIQGDQVSISSSGKKRSLTFSGTIEDNKMSGTTSNGTSWTATRQ